MLLDARNPQGGTELSTSGHPDPSGLTGASLPTPHSPLNLTCFLTALWTRALDAGSGDTVGTAPDLGGTGRSAGGEVGAGDGVIPGRRGGEGRCWPRRAPQRVPSDLTRPARPLHLQPCTPGANSQTLHPRRLHPDLSSAPRGPTWGGRSGALVALVKLEEKIKVELLVLLQPRHVGPGRGPGSEAGIEGHCQGLGSGVTARGRGQGPGFGLELGSRVPGRGSRSRVRPGSGVGVEVGGRGRVWGHVGPGLGSRVRVRGRGPGRGQVPGRGHLWSPPRLGCALRSAARPRVT